jgi:hypothetical protein
MEFVVEDPEDVIVDTANALSERWGLEIQFTRALLRLFRRYDLARVLSDGKYIGTPPHHVRRKSPPVYAVPKSITLFLE